MCQLRLFYVCVNVDVRACTIICPRSSLLLASLPRSSIHSLRGLSLLRYARLLENFYVVIVTVNYPIYLHNITTGTVTNFQLVSYVIPHHKRDSSESLRSRSLRSKQISASCIQYLPYLFTCSRAV